MGGHICLRSATAFRKVEAGGGFTFDTGWFEGEILVDNLAFDKRVGVAYTRDGGTTWNMVNGSYLGPVQAIAANVAGVEVWKFKTPQLNIELDLGRLPLRGVLRDDGLGRHLLGRQFRTGLYPVADRGRDARMTRTEERIRHDH